ncbi:MAG: NAD(P)H-dependent glycerol-3-phosphate dehydrogenase [Fimbriiglobus sp.]
MSRTPKTFAVLGSGGWGTALARHLAAKPGLAVRLWSARPETAHELLSTRINSRQLPGVKIPESVMITSDAHEATDGADVWVVAIPTVHLRNTLARLPQPNDDTILVSLTKGLEQGSFARPSQILTETLGSAKVVVLSGPSHAEEVAQGRPTSLVAASRDATQAQLIQEAFGTARLRVYTNTDVLGVELAGALKNVIGIAAGICDGLQFGDNAKSAMLTRGLVEMTRFGTAMGAQPGTFAGLAGMGDLITTCFSKHGRNRLVGEQLARGTATLAEVLARPQVAEGVTTAKSVFDRTQSMLLSMPIMTGVYEVLYEGKNAHEAVQELLARAQRGENTFLTDEVL